MAARKLVDIDGADLAVAKAIHASEPNTNTGWDKLHPGTQNILRSRAAKVLAVLDGLLEVQKGNGRDKKA